MHESTALVAWWRHQMDTFSASLAVCAENSPVLGEFPAQRPVTRSFDVSFDLRPNKRLSNQSWGWWFETPSCPLWRHCNGIWLYYSYSHSFIQPWRFLQQSSLHVKCHDIYPRRIWINSLRKNSRLLQAISLNTFRWNKMMFLFRVHWSLFLIDKACPLL